MSATRIRGACPTLAVPMATGDGLLARLHAPTNGLAPTALAGLAEAVQAHGNGIVEVTARGSLQIRGLSDESASRLAKAVDGLNIEVRTGVPVDAPPLAGLDPHEIADPHPLARTIRQGIVKIGLEGRLAPKVTVIVDGGGALHLADVAADLRLMAENRDSRIVWNLALAGSAADAAGIAALADNDTPTAVLRLLEAIAARGRTARARDLDGPATEAALRGLPVAPFRRSQANRAPRPVGLHPLANGGAALGVGLAYGQAAATDLRALAQTASALGIESVRSAPGRAMLFLCPRADIAKYLKDASKDIGFIVDSNDRRLSITACAGAPACRSAHLATKPLAARLLADAPQLFDGSMRLHLSGCSKRCAAPQNADVTLIGGEDAPVIETQDGERRELTGKVAEDAILAVFRRAATDYTDQRNPRQSAVAALKRAALGNASDDDERPIGPYVHQEGK
ncbi:precorrin-3B synthase [Mesorhizobium xinjiangense]|uniref:precorrin-3B synthase n=1 Tax=Mesorhizobium xinjiangense TaxID=2678685 RepID=UPI0012ED3CE0|nr:precorrin-3B synthase [Mesorhizobium xinjiangense]